MSENMTEEFGINGEIKFNSYKRQYEEIARKIRRGELDNNEASFYPLYNVMINDLKAIYKKQESFKKNVLICLVILIVIGMAALSSDTSSQPIAIFGAIPLAIVLWKRRSQNKELDAIFTFDKQYLDCAVTDRLKS